MNQTEQEFHLNGVPLLALGIVIFLFVCGLFLNILEAASYCSFKEKNWKEFPRYLLDQIKDSMYVYVGIILLPFLIIAVVAYWDEIVELKNWYTSSIHWYVIPVAVGVIATIFYLIFHVYSPVKDIGMAKKNMRKLGVVIKFVGIAVVWYELNWIVAIGIFLVLWGNNISTRLNVQEELIDRKLIDEASG